MVIQMPSPLKMRVSAVRMYGPDGVVGLRVTGDDTFVLSSGDSLSVTLNDDVTEATVLIGREP